MIKYMPAEKWIAEVLELHVNIYNTIGQLTTNILIEEMYKNLNNAHTTEQWKK